MILKVAATEVTKHVPKLWSRFVTFWRGTKLLVLGPGASGKSSFIDCLSDGELRAPTDEHRATAGIKPHPAVTLDIGADKRLIFRVKSIHEVAGQGNSALHHANMIATLRAKSVVVLLDFSAQGLNRIEWFRMFCDHLCSALKKNTLDINRIRTFIICLNKFDLVKADDDAFNAARGEVRREMMDRLHGALSVEQIKSIRIMPCICIRTEHGKTFINDVIVALARGD